MELICPEHEVILIFSVSFGRLNSHICPEKVENKELKAENATKAPEKVINTNCESESSWLVAFEKCMGRQNCTLTASIEEFGDPCPGTRKYLSVSHTCRPRKNI